MIGYGRLEKALSVTDAFVVAPRFAKGLAPKPLPPAGPELEIRCDWYSCPNFYDLSGCDARVPGKLLSTWS